MNTQIDVRHVLPAISVPALILHRVGDLEVNIERGVGLPRTFPEHASWRCRVTTICRGRATRIPSSTKFRSF